MTEYPVADASGALVAIHVRRDLPDGGKVMPWRLPDGTDGLDDLPTADLPLYGIHRALGSRVVVVTEGEKAAQALMDVRLPAVGTVTGALGTPSPKTLSDLAGKVVILWPDADDVGRQHMERIAKALTGVATSVRWIQPGVDQPKGWDAADAIAEGGKTLALDLIEAARDADFLPAQAVSSELLQSPTSRLVLLNTVAREHVDWLWRDRMPLRKLVVVEGDPGLGKSTFMLDIAARVTTAAPMPGSDLERDPAGVVILTAEDGLGDTVRPRLEAAGADLAHVAALTAIVDDAGDRLPHLPDDLAHVEQAVRDMDARLVIIDPLMAYLSGEVNSYRDQDVRRALAPAAAMAERTGAAVAVIRHLNKSTGSSALYRGGGSIGITGAARAVLLVGVDPDDEDRRIVAVSKSNLAPIPPALAYRLVADDRFACARVEWEGPTEHRAADLLAMGASDEARDARRDAIEFLRELLPEPMLAMEVRRRARQEGIADRTLDRAKKDAGVASERRGFGPGSQVYWHIERHTAPHMDRRPMASYGISVEDDYPASAWSVEPVEAST